MLENVDLKAKLSKKDYKKIMEELGERLGIAQRAAREAKRPVLIVFEGWRGNRRNEIINTILQYMDARGMEVYSSVNMGTEDLKRPFFTFFWQHLPADGNVTMYQRSWYYFKHKCEQKNKKLKFDDMGYKDINAFEKVLTEDNYIVLKFFLHLSKDKQLSRKEYKGTTFSDYFTSYDDDGAEYEEWYDRYDKMLEETNTPNAPWTLIANDDPDVGKVQVFKGIVEGIEKAIERGIQITPEEQRADVKYDVLSKYKTYQPLEKKEYQKELEKYQERLRKLQIEMHKRGIAAVIGFEGWDAGGKGGSIRRLTQAMDPMGYKVYPVASPNAVERQYNHLWRFWIHLPEPGQIAIFDRTWYGRVMVERLEGFAQAGEWQRAFEEMNDMEKQWTDHGMVVLKFWLQISKEEQLRRFTDRQNTPNKQWKITDEDWRNRDKWDAYEEAVNEMLVRTDKANAPWTVVEGDNKYHARIKVLKTVVEAFEKRLKED